MQRFCKWSFFFSIFFLAACSTPSFAPPALPPTVWSPTVDGIRGRLIVERGPEFYGADLAVVYLEIQNLTNLLEPRQIFFDTSGLQFKWSLSDAAGAKVPQTPTALSSLTPYPYWIALPCNSTLRFQVSIGGYGINPNIGGIALQLPGFSAFWQVPRNQERPLFLSATFTNPAPPDPYRLSVPVDTSSVNASSAVNGKNETQNIVPGNDSRLAWHGTLVLPAVPLPE
jgi:hypothetical protein